jgi:hypothetical protein
MNPDALRMQPEAVAFVKSFFDVFPAPGRRLTYLMATMTL